VKPNDREVRRAIHRKYADVARSAEGLFAYPTGAAGARALGYDDATIARAPAEVLRSFCGVGNPFALGPIGPADAVLDLGCGAGFDLLAAARRARRAVGIDLTAAMARRAAEHAAAGTVRVVRGALEELPFVDASFDVVLSNGVLNLSPRKERALAEAFRVLAPGGRLQIADIVLKEALRADIAADPDAWAG